MRDYYNPRCQPPWNENDLNKKCENAFKYARGAAGQATPEAAFMNFAPSEPPPAPAISSKAEGAHQPVEDIEEKPKQPKGNAQTKALLACTGRRHAVAR